METLKLIPNPYVFIDHLGRVAGTHPIRPDSHNGGCHKIGARVSRDVSAKLNPLGGPGTGNTPIVQDTIWEHDAEPFTVEHAPGDSFFAIAVKVGDIFPADKATADLLGVEFKDPFALLASARAKAITDWTTNHGEPPAFASSPCPVGGARLAAKPTPKTTTPTVEVSK